MENREDANLRIKIEAHEADIKESRKVAVFSAFSLVAGITALVGLYLNPVALGALGNFASMAAACFATATGIVLGRHSLSKIKALTEANKSLKTIAADRKAEKEKRRDETQTASNRRLKRKELSEKRKTIERMEKEKNALLEAIRNKQSNDIDKLETLKAKITSMKAYQQGELEELAAGSPSRSKEAEMKLKKRSKLNELRRSSRD